MTAAATVAQLDQFDEVIDVRTPPEFAEDHIPGAKNFPVLSAAERAEVGTLYKQASSFEAKKLGAALIARNIAQHLDGYFSKKPKHWRPLVYCWRGGKRSGAMAHILSEVGWKVARLEGGYKAFRRRVIDDLEQLPHNFTFEVICGPTGSGKSRLLSALAQAGAQVLDLEQLAAHRGSVLGNLPDTAQPAQKMFESQVWQALRGFDPGRKVYVEAESKKIGRLRVPETLIARIWQGACVRLELNEAQRVQLLHEDYAHFHAQPAELLRKLSCLESLHGKALLAHWTTLAEAGAWDEFVQDLLRRHYDPAYQRSTLHHFPGLAQARVLRLSDIRAESYAEAAQELLSAASQAA